jgi:hypothetical protein
VREGHWERIVREAGDDVVAALADRLAPTDLQSLLLEVYRQRAERIGPAGVLAQYGGSRFVRPSPVDPRRMIELEALAFELTPSFAAVELSPVCPLGTVSVLGGVSQNWTIATSRNNEVVSDPTNCLALECATRRRAGEEPVRLCTSHRAVRTQTFDAPMSFAHFRLFALCTAGRDRGGMAFELESMVEHLRFHIGFLTRLGAGAVRVALTDWEGAHETKLTGSVIEPLQAEFAGAVFGFNPDRTAGRGYYKRFSFEVLSRFGDRELSVTDGGFTDWTAKLLSNRKERLLISAIGLERICLVVENGAAL